MRARVAVLVTSCWLAACPSPRPSVPPPTPEPTVEPTATLTPSPTPSPWPAHKLIGYYSSDNARYGRFEGAAALDTIALVDRFGAIKDSSSAQETCPVLALRVGQVLDRLPAGKPIWLAVDYRWESAGCSGDAAAVGLILDEVSMRGRWGDVVALGITDEPDGGASEVEQDAQELLAILDAKGLRRVPLSVTSTESSILQGAAALVPTTRGLLPDATVTTPSVNDYVTGPGMLSERVPAGMRRVLRRPPALRGALAGDHRGWMAPSLGLVVVEAYAPLQLVDADDEVVAGWPLVSIDRQLATVRAARPDMHFGVVVQAYGRNFRGDGRLGWYNPRTLALLNRQTFVACEERPEVVFYALFTAGRATGTYDVEHPELGAALKPVHSTAKARIASTSAPWPALPPDLRPGPIVRLAISPTYLDQWGYVNGPSDPPKQVSAPLSNGAILLYVRAYDRQRELSDIEKSEKQFWRRLGMVATCGGVAIEARPIAGAPWHAFTSAPWGHWNERDQTERQQALILTGCAAGQAISVTATLGSVSASITTPAVR